MAPSFARTLLASLAISTPALTSSAPTVTVLNGTYQGYHLPSYLQHVFLRMLYAQPPTGDSRFRAPASLNTTWNGTRTAVDYSDVCMQYFAVPDFPIPEDCLTLDVVRPTLPRNQSLPVAVWIHGGGSYSGSSAATSLRNVVPQSVSASKPVIAVSLNYRLTAFGFLRGNDTELRTNGSANNGLRYQNRALHGALSVGKHLIAYGGRDYGQFRGGIMESGRMVEKWPYNVVDSTSYTNDLWTNLTVTTGCASAISPLECLRYLPLDKLTAALNVSDCPVFSGTGLGPWLTQVDGDFLQDGPSASLEKGHFIRGVSILYTTNTDEATVFGFGGIVNTDEKFRSFVAGVNAVGLPAGYTPTFETDETCGKQWKRGAAFHTDAVETASRRRTVD